MLIHPKNKIIAGLLVVASTVVLALGLLFYSLSQRGSISAKNSTETSSEFTTTKVDNNAETKEAPHFSIFSILNKLIPN
ncbi:MAG: hypothetical protein IPI93_03475 [Sphingobacteriaceae bacterium]|nr:hypothetical protein [Sphingobacteriaceae bacterium]MBK7819094.1 hypothetical protein [Sphingobacteriaceae bacterium]